MRRGTARGDEPWLAGPASRLAAAAGLGAGADTGYRPWFMADRAALPGLALPGLALPGLAPPGHALPGFAPPWFAAP